MLEAIDIELPAGVEPPELLATPDGCVCSAGFQDSSGHHVWRIRQDRLLKLDEPMPVESEIFVAHASETYGDRGRRAAWFLVDNMSTGDRAALSEEFLMTNLDLAFKARTNFPWARAISEPMFLNDVLPYASLDEPRDEWRTDFYRVARDIVRDRSGIESADERRRRSSLSRQDGVAVTR